MPENNTSQGKSDSPPFRAIPAELRLILNAHRQWLDTRGKRGQKAALSNYDFRNLNLMGENLARSDLSGAQFQGANLRDVKFQDADLQGADLSDTWGLAALNLARANLKDCRLPEEQREFAGLGNIKDASSVTSVLFMAMLTACVYTGITVFTASDVVLLTNAGSTTLPLLGVSMDVFYFYLAAPFLLLAIYIYFHFNLQHLWGALANLPAVFPDGNQVDQKVYPWLFNWLPSSNFLRLRTLEDRRTFQGFLQKWLAVFLGWFFLPITMVLLWGRYLYVRHPGVTVYHIVIITLTILFGVWSCRLARITLRGENGKKRGGKVSGILRNVVVAGPVLFLLFTCSDGFIHGISDPRRPPPFNRWMVLTAFEVFGLKTVVNFEEKDVSTRFAESRGTPGDQGADTEIPLARGAQLANRDLRHAEAKGAFLAKADLREANMQGAYLRGADLREAKLGESGEPWRAAILEKSHLFRANLKKACLYRANLYQAYLVAANLSEANLELAVLAEANLLAANLQGAKLKGTIFRAANLQGADFTGAKNLEENQIIEAKAWVLARYDGPLTEKLGLPKNHGDLLKARNFSGLNLVYANLQEVDLSNFDFTGANLLGADLGKANLYRSNFNKANLTKAQLSECRLRLANFQGANLEKTDLKGANLQWAKLHGAKGLKEEQLKAARNWSLAFYDEKMIRSLKLPLDHNYRLLAQRLDGYDLRDAALKGAFLVRANLQDAKLQGADLSLTELREANLERADLSGANLEDSFLGGVNLRGAKLHGAKVSRAMFIDADLRGADLSGTDLSGALNLTASQLKDAKTDSQTRLP
jgi:uncharacterized protein YjbI with pentapeptide repeats